MKVLVAEDTQTNLLLIKKCIENDGHRVLAARDGEQAVALFDLYHPDLVLLDVMMPGMDGYEAARRIRTLCNSRQTWVPIIFVTSMAQDQDIAAGIAAGGDDYLTKPIRPLVLAAKLRAMQRIAEMREQLAQANHRLKALSEQDGLTGIANRRHFEEVLAREVLRARRNAQPLALLMIDIDHFKAYNDHYGHPQGDECLKRVAGCIASRLRRPGDLAGRYGGEEFTVLLPNTPLAGTLKVAETLRASTEALQIGHQAAAPTGHVTISIGAGWADSRHLRDCEAGELTRIADRALYQAKREGRNRVAWITLGETLLPSA